MNMARIEDGGDRLIVRNLNAGRRGALTPELYEAIHEAVGRASDRRIRSVILATEGGFFCSGGDITQLRTRRELDTEGRRAKIDGLHGVIRALRALPVPVIAAVEGGAAGAGLSLMLACDLVIADETAQFTAAYVKAGLVPDGGLTTALARGLSRQAVMEVCILGRPISAERLHAAGLINFLVTPGGAEDKAACVASTIAAGPRQAQGAIKALVNSAFDASEAAQLDAERDAMADAQVGAEAAEGLAAFLEKRRPNF
jgi:2-(1,2-epoxy-1,2-dihydrophenyl)acetyl-CoA isomerase